MDGLEWQFLGGTVLERQKVGFLINPYGHFYTPTCTYLRHFVTGVLNAPFALVKKRARSRGTITKQR